LAPQATVWREPIDGLANRQWKLREDVGVTLSAIAANPNIVVSA